MSWQNDLKDDPLPWLLEASAPGVRYLTMKNILHLAEDDPELAAARQAAYTAGPIAAVLAGMDPAGYWVEPGPGYNPKYRSTVWAMILLAQLNASVADDERIARACTYLLDHALTPGGQFTLSGAPSGTIDCLQGNLCWALASLGCRDPRLVKAYEWMARSVTGEGVAPASNRQARVRYYAGKCGPRFECGANNRLPCAWGAAKVMLAFSVCPEACHSPLVESALQQGVDFLFSIDLTTANYPSGYSAKPSQNWWKFGFPVFYVTDLLQIAEALVALGYGHDPRLRDLLDRIVAKGDSQGRWLLEYDYSGKTWADFGSKKQPNPWVTLRVLQLLQRID